MIALEGSENITGENNDETSPSSPREVEASSVCPSDFSRTTLLKQSPTDFLFKRNSS